MIVVIDNTGTQPTKMFLPKIIAYLEERKLQYKIIKGDTNGLHELKELKPNDIHQIILSGSPIMLNDQSNKKDYVCNLYCLDNLQHIPTIGICFGCQLIIHHYKGTLYDTGSVICKTVNASSSFKTHKVKLCARYLPKKVTNAFDILMHLNVENKEYPCLIKHKHLPLVGVMFHPEALKSTHWTLDYFLTQSSM